MTLTRSSAATLPSTRARPPPASARRKSVGSRSRIDPAGAEVGLFEAGAEDVRVAGGGGAGDARAGLDEEGAGAGRGGVLDPPAQEGELTAAAAAALQGAADPELGDLATQEHRRAGLRLAVDLGDVA